MFGYLCGLLTSMSKRRLATFAVVVTTATLVQVPLFGAPAQAATVVCNRYCDGRDPGLAGSDRVPVSSVLYGRTFRVHVNDTDAMVWGSVDGGPGRVRQPLGRPLRADQPQLPAQRAGSAQRRTVTAHVRAPSAAMTALVSFWR
jgi:hypothetical protein